MRTISLVGMVRNLVLVPLVALSAACGDVSPEGEELQGSLPQAVIDDTAAAGEPAVAARGKPAPAPVRKGYEVVIMDLFEVNHQPSAINNRGQISGSLRNPEDVRQAWFWDGERDHFIVGDRVDGAGTATDLNDLGQVVGSTLFLRDTAEEPGTFTYRTRAFVYDGATVTDFGVLPGNSHSRASGINRRGDVVGASYGGYGEQHAVLFQDGCVIDLGYGYARAINNRGQIVGDLLFGDRSLAFLYSDGQAQNLGALEGDAMSYAMDINDRGEIVGNSVTGSGNTRAFLYSRGAMSVLPAPGEDNTAIAINRSGQVIGTARTAITETEFETEPYLYEKGEAALLRDLLPDDGCWKSLEVSDINDHGDIVGIGVMNDGATCGEVGRFLIVITRQPNRYR
jgi:probable HAF family extracellular repeat protein